MLATLKQTPLFNKHLHLNARMAPFAGYSMPISYDQLTGGQSKEHLHVRKKSGIFDISHMGEFWVRGPQATEFLSFVCTRSLHSASSGKAVYCLLLDASGGIVDDIIVYKINNETFWVVVNAANVEKDWAHLNELSKDFKVQLDNVSEETALIALQGPEAKNLAPKLFPGVDALKYYTFTQIGESIVARTGYTGEDGFEFFVPTSAALKLWDDLISLGSMPIGLGARDTLRLEVGFPLYGHELLDSYSPWETLSAFAADKNHRFYGYEGALSRIKKRPIALLGDTPKPFRQGDPIFWNNKPVGIVTSGSTSPILKRGVALGIIDLYVPQETSIFTLESGGKARQADRVELPFVTTERTKKRVAENSKLAV